MSQRRIGKVGESSSWDYNSKGWSKKVILREETMWVSFEKMRLCMYIYKTGCSQLYNLCYMVIRGEDWVNILRIPDHLNHSSVREVSRSNLILKIIWLIQISCYLLQYIARAT